MQIYHILFAEKPQQLENLHDYNMREHGEPVSKPIETPITGYIDLSLEEIDKEIRKPPESQARVV